MTSTEWLMLFLLLQIIYLPIQLITWIGMRQETSKQRHLFYKAVEQIIRYRISTKHRNKTNLHIVRHDDEEDK